VRQRLDAQFAGRAREQLPEPGIAREGVGQVGDEVGQLVAGVAPFEDGGAVDVVAGVDEPVRVEDDDRVDAGRAAAAADLGVAVDRVLARALARRAARSGTSTARA